MRQKVSQKATEKVTSKATARQKPTEMAIQKANEMSWAPETTSSKDFQKKATETASKRRVQKQEKEPRYPAYSPLALLPQQ